MHESEDLISHGQSTVLLDRWVTGTESLRQTIGRVDFRQSPHEHIVIIQLRRRPLQNCRLGVFQDAACPEDVLDTLFFAGGILYVCAPQTY